MTLNWLHVNVSCPLHAPAFIDHRLCVLELNSLLSFAAWELELLSKAASAARDAWSDKSSKHRFCFLAMRLCCSTPGISVVQHRAMSCSRHVVVALLRVPALEWGACTYQAHKKKAVALRLQRFIVQRTFDRAHWAGDEVGP
jgi:hypothetical protein